MNLNHQSFITEYLRHRSPFTAYCLAYNLKDCSNYDSIMSSANRLMNNEEVGGTIRSILDNIRHEVEQEVRAEMKQELLTVQRKRELLASIATGEMVAVQLYKGKDCNVCTQMVRPTINQMLKAIDLDNKMVGLYPVFNRQVTKGNNSQQNTTIHCEQPTPNPSQEGNEKGNHNPAAAGQQTTTNEKAPLLFLGGESRCGGTGVVDSSRTDNTTDQNKSQQNPEKNTQIGNNGAALNEANENYPERINSQQTEMKNTTTPNKMGLSLPNSHITELPNRPISHAGLRKLLASKPKTPH